MTNTKPSKKALLLTDTVTHIIEGLTELRNIDQEDFEEVLNELISIIENKPTGRAVRMFLEEITTGSHPAGTDPKGLEDVIIHLIDRLSEIKNSDAEDYNGKISALRQRILNEIYSGADSKSKTNVS